MRPGFLPGRLRRPFHRHVAPGSGRRYRLAVRVVRGRLQPGGKTLPMRQCHADRPELICRTVLASAADSEGGAAATEGFSHRFMRPDYPLPATRRRTPQGS